MAISKLAPIMMNNALIVGVKVLWLKIVIYDRYQLKN